MGESLEDCVKREIREEVGIEVKNIRYFGSQPWAFSSSLMVGFTAEHASGDISVDNVEIEHAEWFSADALPDIPGKLSIARELIDWFVENQK
jgi:NAD+ diphosphatase